MSAQSGQSGTKLNRIESFNLIGNSTYLESEVLSGSSGSLGSRGSGSRSGVGHGDGGLYAGLCLISRGLVLVCTSKKVELKSDSRSSGAG